MSTEQEAAEQEAAEAGAAAAASFSDVFQSALSEIRGTFGEALMQGIDDATGQAAGAASGAAADAATVLEAGLRQAFSNAASGAKEVLQNSLQQAFDDATGILQSSFVDAVHDAATGGGEAGMILAEGFTLAVTTGMRGLADKVGLGGVVDHMIAVGQGFEGALSTIGEVSGATEEQLEQVAVRAKELGSDAGVVNTSVNDAAAAMAGLAVSGFSVEESMSAARSALQLAAAAHLDASEAAAVQTDVLKAFGLGAESARLAADVLAGSSNRLGIGVSAIGQELSESGAVAGQLGMTMADTAAALVAFGEAEVPVSEVDSVLGSVLSAFTTDSKEANEAIERLGLTLGEIPAEFVGLPALFDQLRTAQLRNGDAAYTSHLSALFGADAMKALSAAAEQGSAGIQSISNEISKQGNASEFAGQQTNQSSEFLKSFNDVVLEVSQGIGTLSATLADLIASGFDAVVNAGKSVIGFFQEHLGVVKVVAAGLATLLLPGLIRLGAELSVVKAKIIATSIADKAAALAKNLYTIATKGAAAAMKLLNTAINASPLGRLLTILLAVGGAVFAFFTQTETGKQIWDAVWSGIQSAFSATWEFLRPLWETFTGWLSNAGNALMWLWEGVVQPVMMWIGDAISAVWNTLIRPVWDGFQFALSNAGNALMWLWEGVVQPVMMWIGDAISAVWNTLIRPVWDGFQFALSNAGNALMWLWEGVVQPVMMWIGDAISTVWNTIIQPVWDGFRNALTTLGDVFRGMWENFIRPAWENFQSGFQTGWDVIKGAIDTGKEWFEDLRDTISSVVDKILEAWNKVKDIISKPFEFLGDITGGVVSVFGGEGKADGGYITGPGSGTSDSIMARLSNGEFVVNARATRQHRGLLESINSGSLPGYADGGLVTSDKLVEFAKDVEGAPYVFGGTNWGDCSGAVAALANFVAGLPPFDTRFWTGNEGSELAKRGFRTGLGPAGSLQIGWYNGGPYGGHTSATLPNGLNFEMGGARGNGQYGGTATGAADASYSDHAHFVFQPVPQPLAQTPSANSDSAEGGGSVDNQSPVETSPAAPEDDRSPMQRREDALFDSIVSNFQSAGDAFATGHADDIRKVFGAPKLEDTILGRANEPFDKAVEEFENYQAEQVAWEQEHGRAPAGLDAPIIYDPNRGPDQFLDLPGRLANAFMARLVPQRYDNGGWLAPGLTLVENKTGRPEPVFNPRQWEQLSELVQPGGNSDNSITIENLHTGMTAAELRRELNLIQKERSLGFVRR